MKKNIIYILLLVFFGFSCGTKDADVEFYNLGTEMYLSTDGMTSLDVEAAISVDNPLKNLSAVDVSHIEVVDPNDSTIAPPSTDLGTITMSDGAGSITLTEAQLGISEQDWTANLMLNAVIDGKEINRPVSISVDNPFSTEDPGITYRDDTSFYFKWSVEPVSATVSSVTIESKVGSEGTYTEIAGTWKAEDSVEFVGSDYVISDTIFVRVTATAGTKTDSEVTELVVSPVSLDAVDEFMLDSTANLAYDLILAIEVDETTAGDSADVVLTSNLITGGFELGIDMPNQAEFVTATSTEYSNADVLVAMSADFSSPITSITNLVGGETYVYRTRRGTGAYSYGYIKVMAVVKPNGVLADSYIEFEHKH